MIYKQYSAVYMIVERESKYYFLKRRNSGYMDGYFGLPAGKIDANEDAISAAIRELKEEIGINAKNEDMELCHVMHRQEFPDMPDNTWIDIFFRVKNWYGEPKNMEPHKAFEGKWLDYRSHKDLIVPAVLHVLEKLETGSMVSTYGWKKIAA